MTEPQTDIYKYYKPHSLTWWLGVFAIICGALLAIPLESAGWNWLRIFDGWLNNLTGDWTPKQYIMMGGGLIGLRGAMK